MPTALGMGVGTLLRLAKPPVSKELIRELEALLQDARDGKIIGIAYVAMVKLYEYRTDWAGEVKTRPTITLGMLHMLDKKIAEYIDGDGPG